MCHYVTMSSFLKVVQRSNITALSLHTHNPLESCATLDASCSNAHHFWYVKVCYLLLMCSPLSTNQSNLNHASAGGKLNCAMKPISVPSHDPSDAF